MERIQTGEQQFQLRLAKQSWTGFTMQRPTGPLTFEAACKQNHPIQKMYLRIVGRDPNITNNGNVLHAQPGQPPQPLSRTFSLYTFYKRCLFTCGVHSKAEPRGGKDNPVGALLLAGDKIFPGWSCIDRGKRAMPSKVSYGYYYYYYYTAIICILENEPRYAFSRNLGGEASRVFLHTTI